ncbi:unnamed protein product [Chrysodeixis includens]|uniref:Fibronectin type-III domain-containing protein n=1 Tax=Chrysodeixis includens TaxID=689277 RepID=A0A9P0C6B8_CHRIL|nr:unnamed protein product [Chrysodeixis includens]
MTTKVSLLSQPCSHHKNTIKSVVLKRKCREIRQSPSMMWKRSIVQATTGCVTGCARAPAALALLLFVFASLASGCAGADLVIEIPGSGAGDAEAPGGGGHYRLDYRPPHGSPAPNFTVPARASTINFVGLPGTKYHFMLYYSNASFADLLTWNQTIITAPEPPTNLTVTLGRNKQATISWSPPTHGDYTGFRFKVIPLTERAEGGARNITVEGAGNWTQQLRELSPGATYQLHAFTLLHDKESAAYASRNFTTKPNTPGKFIVWFRNETTLLVLWQPPYPPGAYTHYKVSIVPPDARDAELYVEKEGEPPGPAQAAFKGLVPGRAYNISVQTVSEPEISAPTTAQYRTVPLRPRNVTAPRADLRETSFRVTWLPPLDESEFEKYQVSVSGAGGGGAARRLAPVLRARNDTPSCAFDGLEPGAPYTVTVKTMSGKVTSWPATADLTLKPLPVRELSWRYADGADNGVVVWWAPADGSTQDEYKVSYHEAGPSRDDSNTLMTSDVSVPLKTLLPGRNYTVTVSAVSRGVESNESVFSVPTRPLAPVLLSALAGERELRLAWRSDVNSRQDAYELRYRRRGEPADNYRTLKTTDTSATLEDLFPGAVYEIQVAAVSYGLRSERHTLLKPVRPLPALWLHVDRATSNSVGVSWAGPARSASALGGFALRYRTRAEPRWTALDLLPPGASSAEIANMTHGEHYIIRLDAVSEDADGETVESEPPRTEEHTVRPNPVTNVEQLVDTRNLTLEWPRPGGRVEWYALRWWPLEAGGAAGAQPVRARRARARRAARPGARPRLHAHHRRALLQPHLRHLHHGRAHAPAHPVRDDHRQRARRRRQRHPLHRPQSDLHAHAGVCDPLRLVPVPAGGRGRGRGGAHADSAGRRARPAGGVQRPRARPPVQRHHVDRFAQRHVAPRAAPGAPLPAPHHAAQRHGHRRARDQPGVGPAGRRLHGLRGAVPDGRGPAADAHDGGAGHARARAAAAHAVHVHGGGARGPRGLAADRVARALGRRGHARGAAARAARPARAGRGARARHAGLDAGARRRQRRAAALRAGVRAAERAGARDGAGVRAEARGRRGGAGAGRGLRVPPARRDGRGRGPGGAAAAHAGYRRAAAAAAARHAARGAPVLLHRGRALPRRLLLARQRQRDGLHAGAGRAAPQRHAGAPAQLARRARAGRVAALPGHGALLPVPRVARGGVHDRLGALRRGRPRLLQRPAQARHALLRQAARLHRARQVHRHRLHARLHRGGQHGVDHRRVRGLRGAGGRRVRAGGGARRRAPRPRSRRRRSCAPSARARRRLHRPLPPHGRRLRLPLQ